MPQVAVAALAAAAGAAATAGLSGVVVAGITISAIGAAAIGAVVGSVVAFGASALLGLNRTPKATSTSTAADNKLTIRQSVSPRRVIYGKARVGGVAVYVCSSGEDRSILWMVIVLAGHRCAGIDTVWINEDAIPPSDMSGSEVVAGKYAGKVRISKYLGTQTAADPNLIAESPDGWSADHKLLGCTYLVMRLQYDRDVFGSVPNITALVRGKDDILDPRTEATGWTDNWALCVLDYLRSDDFGLGCADDEIEWGSIMAAANLSDELVDLDESGSYTQPRYRLNGAFTLDQKPIDIMDGMLAAGAGTLVYVMGQYRLHGGAYTAPSASLDLSDPAGSIQVQTLPPRSERFNIIGGTFIDPDKFWQASEFGVLQDDTALAQDGEEQRKDIDLAFVADRTQAQRLARQMLLRSRHPITVKVPLRYEWVQLCVWQVISLTVPDFGWAAKAFRITGFEFAPATGSVSVTLQEEVAAAYAWYYDDAVPGGDNPDSTLISPIDIPAPTGLAVTPSTVMAPDGTTVPALVITWTAAPHAYVTAHEVQWSYGGGDWQSATVPYGTNQYVIRPAILGGSYSVRVRAVAGLARSPWTDGVTASGAPDTTPPAVPTGLAAIGSIRGISVTWTVPTDPDLSAVEVYEAASSDPAGRAYVGESKGTGFRRENLGYGTTRYYWVRSRDLTGNRSAFAGPVSATSEAVQRADFAAGIQPVTVVSSIPTAYVTDFIVNTADRKTYRWNGTAYTAAVPAVDITGTLTNEQIAGLDAAKLAGTIPSSVYGQTLRPVEIVTSLPGTGNFQGRVVLLKSDNKTYRWTSSSATTGTTYWSAATDAGDITTGQLQAGRIAASSISSRELAIGDFLNKADNGTFSEGAAGWAASGGGALPAGVSVVTNDSANAYIGTGYLRVAGASSGILARNSNVFPAAPGARFYLRARAKCDSGTSQAVQVRINWLNASLSSIGTAALTFPTTATSYTMLDGSPSTISALIAPSGTSFGVAEVYAASSISSGGWRVGEVYVARQGGGELIVDGSITAAKADVSDLKANILTAGSVTTSMLSVGSGNWVWNSCCTRTADGWIAGGNGSPTVGSASTDAMPQWALAGLGSGYVHVTGTLASGQTAYADWRPNASYYGVACSPGDRIQARALLGTHRCAGLIQIFFLNSAGTTLAGAGSTATSALQGGTVESGYAQHSVIATAPANTALALLRIVAQGNGGADAYCFFSKAMLSKAPANATEVGDWSPGGVTEISGGQLRANTVEAKHINAANVFSDSGVFNNLTAGIAQFGGLSAAQLRVDQAIITQTLQLGDTIVSTGKISSGAATASAGIDFAVPDGSVSAPGSGYAVAILSGVTIAVAGDGRVVIHAKPPHWYATTTSSPGGGGSGGGDGPGGGGL